VCNHVQGRDANETPLQTETTRAQGEGIICGWGWRTLLHQQRA